MSKDQDVPWDSDEFPLRMATDVKAEDFYGGSSVGGNPKRGKVVAVNGKKLAVFLHDGKVYAIDEKCPHLGGPLHLGDIEDIGCGESPRVRCPWHKWCFELATGKQVRPHLGGKSTTTYPARLRENGQIEIGFQSLDKNYFTSSDF